MTLYSPTRKMNINSRQFNVSLTFYSRARHFFAVTTIRTTNLRNGIFTMRLQRQRNLYLIMRHRRNRSNIKSYTLPHRPRNKIYPYRLRRRVNPTIITINARGNNTILQLRNRRLQMIPASRLRTTYILFAGSSTLKTIRRSTRRHTSTDQPYARSRRNVLKNSFQSTYHPGTNNRRVTRRRHLPVNGTIQSLIRSLVHGKRPSVLNLPTISTTTRHPTTILVNTIIRGTFFTRGTLSTRNLRIRHRPITKFRVNRHATRFFCSTRRLIPCHSTKRHPKRTTILSIRVTKTSANGNRLCGNIPLILRRQL